MKREPKVRERAYSLLTIKAIDEDQRIITGIASTPEADRVGDIVEPAGADFKLPLPFLKHHNAREPIGEVFDAKITPAGIEVKCRVLKIAEPLSLKERLDEAWAEIKNKLVRGLSIGFQPVEYTYLEDTGGLRFVKWLWLELSAVTIPANQDATIMSIKSLDSDAEGSRKANGGRVVRLLPGDSGSGRRAASMKKTIQEQITAFEATRAAKTARMGELMDGASEKGETLGGPEAEEYDGLEADVTGIDKHLVRLRALEQTNKAAATPATGGTADEASRSRGTQVIHVKDNLPPGIEFTRYAMVLAAAKGNPLQALEIAKARYPDLVRVHTVLKAAIEAGTTSDPAWAGPLVPYQQYAGDFVDFLRPQTIVGRFGTGNIPSLTRVPFNVQIKGQTTGGQGYWVGQGKPKPLTKFDFDAQSLRWAKVANIAVITEELARFSSPSAEQLVRAALAGALIERLDIDFIDPAKVAVADVSPASVTNGANHVAATGTDAASVRADVATLLGYFITANISPTTAVWVMSATTALALSLMVNSLGQPEFPGISMQGGLFMGIPVIVSQYAALDGSPGNALVALVNAADIYLADDGQVVIDVSREASLEMSDAPTNSVSTGSPNAPVATSLVSLWQTNSIGIKAERFINWARRRPEGVAYLSGVNWSGASGS